MLPNASRTINKKQETRNKKPMFLVSSFKFQVKKAFSLIEILISLMLVGGLVVLLLSATGTLKVRNKSSYENIAAKWMGDEFTKYRNEDFNSFKPSGQNFQNKECRHNSTTQEAEYVLYPPPPPAPATGYSQETEYPPLARHEACMGWEIYDHETSGMVTTNTKLVRIKLKAIWLDDNKKSKSLTNESIIYENGL